MKKELSKSTAGKYTIIYVRVSTDDQAKNGHSLDYQLDVCLKKAKELNLDNILQFVDDGYSGTSLNRPEIKRIINYIEDGKVDNVIIYDLDRLSRNIRDSISLIQLAKDYNVNLIGVNYDTSLSTADQRFLFHIKTALSQLESEKISERTINGMKGGMAKGKYTISKPPYGYYREGEHLVANLKELEHVARIFEMYTVDMFSTEVIAKQMTLIAERPFSSSTICRMLKNERYTGQFTYRGVVFHELGFLPTITLEMYEIAVERLATSFSNLKYDYIFYKKLTCSACGDTLVNKSTIKKKKSYLYYMCNNPECSCYTKRINQNRVYEMLYDNLVKLYNKHTFSFFSKDKSIKRIVKLEEISRAELRRTIAKHFKKTNINLE